MTPPNKIYIGKTIWSEEKIDDKSPAYFSEQAVREAAFDMLNTSWADSNFDRAIEFMIDRLKGGGNG